MKQLPVFLSFLLTTIASAESAWQYLPEYGGAEGFLERNGSLYVVFESGLILATEDGATWRQVADLGEGLGNINVTNVLSTDTGIGVWTREFALDGSFDGYRLYRSTDGEVWELALESPPAGADEPAASLGGMWQVDEGWLLHTERNKPAIVWFSSDGFTWEEVYRDDERAFQTGEYRTGAGHAFKFAEPHSDTFIVSADGFDWNLMEPMPQRIIDAGSYLIGSANNPLANGRVFYSEDGTSWEPAYQPEGRTQPQLFVRGGGVNLMITNHRSVAYSANGRDWQMAEFPEDLLEGMNFPFVPTIVYSGGAFYYRLVPHPPPDYEGPELGAFTFSSSDGASWVVSSFPDPVVDEADWGQPNPDYVSPPAPHYNPHQLIELAEKEVRIDGYSLKMEALPEGRKIGLYLAGASGVYEIVNTSFGNPFDEYPFTPPVDIAAVGQTLFVLTQTGRIGLFDPSENYLPQPTKVNASKGEFDDTIQVLWQPVEGALAYRVYRGNMGENEVLEIGMTGETEYRDTSDLSLDHSYFYQIEAVGDGRVSMLSEPAIGQLWSIIFCYYSMWEADGLTDSPYPVKRFMYDASSDLSHYPWIYTQAHHWQDCVEEPGMLWLYDLQLGWIWTRHSFYPNLYQASEERWLYSIAADPAKRWFYDHDAGSFFPVER